MLVSLHLQSGDCKVSAVAAKNRMSDNIKHSGVVESVSGSSVKVRILQTSACASCKVAGHCNASEAKEKLVDVFHVDTRGVHVGDAVTVVASASVARHALLLGFGVPFLLLVVVLVGTLWATGNEALAALSALASLLPYYIVLYLLRETTRRRLAFALETESSTKTN